MARPKFRDQYDTKEDDKAGEASLVHNIPDEKDVSPTGAQQQFRDDVDINVIARRLGLEDENANLPRVTDPRYYGDFTQARSLREMLDSARVAQERFNDLPADIRERFNHDPQKLWEFVNNEKNLEEAVQIGLLKKEITPDPIRVIVQEPTKEA